MAKLSEWYPIIGFGVVMLLTFNPILSGIVACGIYHFQQRAIRRRAYKLALQEAIAEASRVEAPAKAPVEKPVMITANLRAQMESE